MSASNKSFWTSLPGVLTGIAALITALTTLYVTVRRDDPTEAATRPRVLEAEVSEPLDPRAEEEWVLVGENTFTGMESGWPTTSGGGRTPPSGFKRFELGIVDGGYRFDYEVGSRAMRFIDSPYGPAVNYRVAVSIRMVNVSSDKMLAGLLFGQKSGVGYQFTVLPTGRWAVHRDDVANTTGTSATVIEWSVADFDSAEWFRVEAEVDDAHVTLRINSQVVGTYLDSSLGGGTVGLYVGADDSRGTAVIDFDNFEFHRKEPR